MSTDSQPNNLVDLFERITQRFPERPVFGRKLGPGEFSWVTYAEVGRVVETPPAGAV